MGSTGKLRLIPAVFVIVTGLINYNASAQNFKYGRAGNFSEGMAIVHKGGKVGYIDATAMHCLIIRGSS